MVAFLFRTSTEPRQILVTIIPRRTTTIIARTATTTPTEFEGMESLVAVVSGKSVVAVVSGKSV